MTESAIGNHYLWQGRWYSWKTGLYYFRARWYDPITGRWLSKDPIGIAGGLNQYVFAGNNPINFRDPWGLCEDEKQGYWRGLMEYYLNNETSGNDWNMLNIANRDFLAWRFLGSVTAGIIDFNKGLPKTLNEARTDAENRGDPTAAVVISVVEPWAYFSAASANASLLSPVSKVPGGSYVIGTAASLETGVKGYRVGNSLGQGEMPNPSDMWGVMSLVGVQSAQPAP